MSSPKIAMWQIPALFEPPLFSITEIEVSFRDFHNLCIQEKHQSDGPSGISNVVMEMK